MIKLDKIAEYLVYLYVFFMVIDPSGSGSLTKIPFLDLSVKYILLLLLLLFILFKYLKWALAGKWPANHFAGKILSLVCFGSFFVLVGFLRGNDPGYIIKDSVGLLFYSVGFILIPFISKKEQIVNLLKVLLFSAFTVVIFLIVTEIQLVKSAISADAINLLIVGNNLGLYVFNEANASFYRISLRAGIFVQVAAALMFSFVFRKRDKCFWLYAFYLLSCLIGLLILFSRGSWLGMIISVLIIVFYNLKNRNIKAMFLILFVVAALSSVVIGMSDIRLENAFADRFISSFNFVSDESNAIRVEQFDMLKNKFIEHPIIGGGFGMNIEGYARDPDQPYIFELDYLAMAMKFGIIGFAVLAGLFFNILRAEYEAIKNIKDKEMRSIGVGVFASVVGLLVTAATNPYLNGVLGNFIVLFSMIIFNVIISAGEVNV